MRRLDAGERPACRLGRGGIAAKSNGSPAAPPGCSGTDRLEIRFRDSRNNETLLPIPLRFGWEIRTMAPERSFRGAVVFLKEPQPRAVNLEGQP